MIKNNRNKKLTLSTDLYNFVMGKNRAYKVSISSNHPYDILVYHTKEDFDNLNHKYKHNIYMFCIQLIEEMLEHNVQIVANPTYYEDFPGEDWFAVAKFYRENQGISTSAGDNFPACVIFVANYVYENIIRKKNEIKRSKRRWKKIK